MERKALRGPMGRFSQFFSHRDLLHSRKLFFAEPPNGELNRKRAADRRFLFR